LTDLASRVDDGSIPRRLVLFDAIRTNEEMGQHECKGRWLESRRVKSTDRERTNLQVDLNSLVLGSGSDERNSSSLSERASAEAKGEMSKRPKEGGSWIGGRTKRTYPLEE